MVDPPAPWLNVWTQPFGSSALLGLWEASGLTTNPTADLVTGGSNAAWQAETIEILVAPPPTPPAPVLNLWDGLKWQAGGAASQVQTFSISDLLAANATLCTFSGLNGNQDVEYEIVLDLLLLNVPADLYCFIQPNGVYTGFTNWVENRSYTTDGVTNSNDAIGNSLCVPYGFPCGHTSFNTGGRLHAVTRISALLINPPQPMGRSSSHSGSYVPNSTGSYVMNWRGGTTWWDGATNITSLRLGCWLPSGSSQSGASANGRASLRVLR
jgi:hypothetical protein